MRVRRVHGYGRTTCDCPSCRSHCRHRPGYLIPEDLENFNEKDLFASKGAIVLFHGEYLQIPTLTPKKKDDGSCIFFTSDERCAIHENAPFGCAFFDDHIPEYQADFLRQYGLMNVLKAWVREETYANIWQRLKTMEL